VAFGDGSVGRADSDNKFGHGVLSLPSTTVDAVKRSGLGQGAYNGVGPERIPRFPWYC
jgi:hypothetical protein